MNPPHGLREAARLFLCRTAGGLPSTGPEPDSKAQVERIATLQHLNRLTSYGVNYRSFTEQYFDSCGIFKDAVISILATIAKHERIRISERVKAGMRNARVKGRRIGRPAHVPLIGQLREKIAEAYQKGEGSLRVIATRFGTSLGTVQRCVAPYAKHRSPGPEPSE